MKRATQAESEAKAGQRVIQTSAQGHPGQGEDRATLGQPRDRVRSRDKLEHSSHPSRIEMRARSFTGLAGQMGHRTLC